jgi:hypothetical protein
MLNDEVSALRAEVASLNREDRNYNFLNGLLKTIYLSN